MKRERFFADEFADEARRWRALHFASESTPAIVVAIVYGLTVGLSRVAMGGHFLSDILFAGVFTALAIWLLHGVFFRWRAPRGA